MLVTVKTNKYCLEIHMSPDAPFSQILEELHSKFLDSAKFFGKAKMALAIFGQTLTYEQTAQILEMITELTQIEIICVLDYDEENEPYWRTLLEQAQERVIQQRGLIHKGSLENHQVLQSESDLVVLGNVEPGARVESAGNIVIVGGLYGAAHAGMGGDHSAFISAITMRPKKMLIGKIEARIPHVYQEDSSIQGPKIAVVDGHRIYIDPLIE
nr:septum site-determining protein MinC [uncultured Mediterraneibacter sp.]